MWASMTIMFAGVWLMAAPAVLGYDGFAADHDRTVGPLLATFGCVAIWEITRSLRRVNSVLGLWLIAAPFVLSFPATAAWNSVLVGVAALLLSLVRGRLTHSFGGGWRSLLPGRELPAEQPR